MTKRISAVVGEYTKDGQQKAEWANIGVVGIGKNGKEYMLLDPTVSLAGVLVKQNALALKRGEQPSDMVMASSFEDVPQNNQQQAYQQPQQNYQQPVQQGGFNQQHPNMNQQGGYQK